MLTTAAVLAAFLAVAGSASAATSARAVKRLLPARTLLPNAIGYPATPTVELQFRPKTVTVNGVDYQLLLDVIQFRDRSFGRDTIIFADLARFDGSLVQAHSYDFEPYDGVGFTLNRTTLATAGLSTGTAIAPSVLQGTFAASEPAAGQTCTLTNGNTGTRLHARGTVSWAQFGIDTATAPFFGVLADGPTAARLSYDPGCAGRPFGHRPHGLSPCPGKLALVGHDRSGDEYVVAATNYGATRTAMGAASYDDGPVASVSHFGYQLGRPGSDLTVPRHGRGGAVARLLSTGVDAVQRVGHLPLTPGAAVFALAPLPFPRPRPPLPHAALRRPAGARRRPADGAVRHRFADAVAAAAGEPGDRPVRPLTPVSRPGPSGSPRSARQGRRPS